MKKFLFFSALAALLLSTAACSSDEPAAQGDDTVTFTVNLQNGNDSRAISDGTKAVNLTAFAYKDGQKVQQQTATFSGLKATVTFKLVKGVKYDFSFWAQSPEAKCYTLSADGTKVNIDYTQAASNVDNDDAFYGVKKDVTVGTASDETVTIYRPFAQLNYGDNLDDYEAAKEAGTEVTKTLVTVKNAANVLDLTTGIASGDVAVTYALADMPSESKELTVDGTPYKWLAMNYLLVPGQVRMADTKIATEIGLITTTLAVYAGETKVNEMSVPNVPVQSNHRTNILGNLLTDKVNFNVVIDPVFDNPDYYDGTYYYVDANTSFQQVIDKINADQPEKAVIMIKGNTEATWNHAESYGSMFGDKRTGKTIATQSVIVIGENKNKVTITGNGVWGIEPNGVAMTFKNIALYDDTRYEYENGNDAWEFAYLELGGNMKFLDCDITDGVMASGDNATFINCNFIADGNAKRKTQSDEYNPWVSRGNATFKGCTFTGYRALKVHEQYGPIVGTVIVDGCTFKDVTVKPGVVLGTLASDVVVTIKNSAFINCAEGSSSKVARVPHVIESDTKLDAFHLTLENNTVK